MFGLSSVVVYLIIGVAIFSSGAFSGWRVESWHRDSLEEKAQKLSDLQVKQEQDKASTASAALEKAKQDVQTRTEVITRTVNKIVDRPVYRNVCLDSDGLRLVQSALQGKTPDPGQPNPALPKPKSP